MTSFELDLNVQFCISFECCSWYGMIRILFLALEAIACEYFRPVRLKIIFVRCEWRIFFLILKVMGLPRKKNYAGRWDVLIDKSTKCLNKLFEVAAGKKRNYVIDQVM